MKKIFFPGCRIKARFPSSSEKLRLYLKEKYQIDSVGCCKENYQKLSENDTAVLICNNCVVEMGQLTSLNHIEYALELIDQDDSFVFPNYSGKEFILQDCEYGYDHPINQTVRSLLDKMNISYTTLENKVQTRQDHDEFILKNASLFNSDVITYCAICNLQYKKLNKNTHYLLDLLFPEDM